MVTRIDYREDGRGTDDNFIRIPWDTYKELKNRPTEKQVLESSKSMWVSMSDELRAEVYKEVSRKYILWLVLLPIFAFAIGIVIGNFHLI